MFPLISHDPKEIGGFLLIARLGSGGMGTVYLARRGNQAVALKVLNFALLTDPHARERLRREAETLQRVSSPYVSRLIDWKVSEEEAWLALSFINGPNLREVITRGGALTGPRWWALAAGLVEALVAFHREDVVHRDLKPSNIIVSSNGPVIIDFGISQVVDATRLTKTGSVEGSPAWLSPEQLESENVGLASDVYSLASTLVYAGTGHSPWGQEEKLTVPVLFSRILANEPRFDGLEPDQVDFLTPLFATDPDARPTAGQLAKITGRCDVSLFADDQWRASLDDPTDDPADPDHTVVTEKPQPVAATTDASEATEPSDDGSEPAGAVAVEDSVETEDESAGANTPDPDTEESAEQPAATQKGQKNKPADKKTARATAGKLDVSPDVVTEEQVEAKQKTAAAASAGAKKRAVITPGRLLALAAAGVALALIAPLWWVLAPSGDSAGDEKPPLALEWISGDLYGQPPAMARATLRDFYTFGQAAIARSSCVGEEDQAAYDDRRTLPVFEIQLPSGSWLLVGSTDTSTGSLVALELGFGARCATESELLMSTVVERDVIEAQQGDDDCVVLRYREPAVGPFEEREERWCVWLDGSLESSNLTLP